LATTPSLIDNAQAHELATRWPAAIDVDVESLEKEYQPKISQPDYSYPLGTTNKVKTALQDCEPARLWQVEVASKPARKIPPQAETGFSACVRKFQLTASYQNPI
jgi:hypothetical protein